SPDDAPRARACAHGQAFVETTSEIHVARRAGAPRGLLARQYRRLVLRGRDDLHRRAGADPLVHRRHPERARSEREDRERSVDAARRSGTGGHVDREGRRPDADDDAEGGARARDSDEPLGPSSRPAVGVPPPSRRSGAFDLRTERRREPVRRSYVISRRRRGLEACAVTFLALTVITIGVVWGTRVAAGSDAYGYVSQVDLWLRGDLHIDQSFGATVPWPLARWTFLPLGYRPEPDGYRIVP